MAHSYRDITPALAAQLKLLMADIDGTLTAPDDCLSPAAAAAISALKNAGYKVGLVSGRTIFELDRLAGTLAIDGPLIAENGGVARLAPGRDMLDMGYTRAPALRALARLKELFPGKIREREDNRERLVDVVLRADVPKGELVKHLPDVKLLDSGFIMHLMQPGISKGNTLLNLLDKLGGLTKDVVMVFGDSTTDLSLFEVFAHSVLVINPRLPGDEQKELLARACFASALHFGDGFAQVAGYLIALRKRYREAPRS